MILSRIKKFFVTLQTLVYVPRCASCGEVLPTKEQPLCDDCERAYLLESKYLCRVCNRAHRMCSCKIRFDGVKIPLLHITGYDVKRSSVSKNIILNLKDNNVFSAFDFVADEMLCAFKEKYIRIFERTNVVITYLPRSKSARKRAGHDQSEQLARRIAAKSGAVFMPLFENNGVKSQKKLDRAGRELNAKQNFSLLAPELRLSGQTVVIVDDVVTTGASIGACAMLAKSVGAKAVIALCAAKTVSEKGIVPKNSEKES